MNQHVHLDPDAVALLTSTRVNVVLTGDATATDRELETICASIRAPIVAWSPRDEPEIPRAPLQTLIIRAIEAANVAQQGHLLSWLDEHADAQVVCTSAAPLYPLVTRGEFDGPLYYRLNQLYFEL